MRMFDTLVCLNIKCFFNLENTSWGYSVAFRVLFWSHMLRKTSQVVDSLTKFNLSLNSISHSSLSCF